MVKLLTCSDVERLLDLPACIAALEQAFRMAGQGASIPSGVLGLAAADGGFHVKAALLPAGTDGARGYFAAKINANFPGNPAAHGLPTIQGVLTLFDTSTGEPLAVMDSIALTRLRTAAATAIAARYLAAPGARTVTIVGCGAQARLQLAALCLVRPIERAVAVDSNPAAAASFARDSSARLGIPVSAATHLADVAGGDIIVTCTTARRAFLSADHVSPGSFVAAVGADNEHKQEIEPALMAASVLVTDSTAQCAAIGDLHHAIVAGAMQAGDVRAELADVVADPVRGRRDPGEVVIFDSTGIALQDVAAAALVYRRAAAEDVGISLRFGE